MLAVSTKRRPRRRSGAQPDGEVFELTDEMALPDAPPSSFHKIDPEDDLEFTESAAVRAAPGSPRSSRRLRKSRRSAAADSVALDRSAVDRPSHPCQHRAQHNARTLEDLVKEMLRPMLKSWLDDNLPGLVERIVKAEIERVRAAADVRFPRIGLNPAFGLTCRVDLARCGGFLARSIVTIALP